MSETNHIQEAKNSKLVALGLASILLCVSMLMSVFAPLPIAFAAVIYGRKKAYGLGVLCSFIAFVLNPSLGFMYAFCFAVSILISEIALGNKPPMRTLTKFGLGLLLVISTVTIGSIKANNMSAKQYIVEQIKQSVQKIEEQKKNLKGADTEELDLALVKLSQPEKVADQIIEVFPSYMFMSVFFVMWANLFLILRSRRILIKTKTFSFSEKDMLKFKVAEGVIWLVIPSLALSIFGEEHVGKTAAIIGTTLVYCFGVFYFFQGFGILMRLLDKWGIYGFFRTLLVMFLVISLHWVIALIGLFDMWVDFSRFTQKKID